MTRYPYIVEDYLLTCGMFYTYLHYRPTASNRMSALRVARTWRAGEDNQVANTFLSSLNVTNSDQLSAKQVSKTTMASPDSVMRTLTVFSIIPLACAFCEAVDAETVQ